MDAVEPMVKVVGAKCLQCDYQTKSWFNAAPYPVVQELRLVRLLAQEFGHNKRGVLRFWCPGQLQIELEPA